MSSWWQNPDQTQNNVDFKCSDKTCAKVVAEQTDHMELWMSDGSQKTDRHRKGPGTPRPLSADEYIHPSHPPETQFVLGVPLVEQSPFDWYLDTFDPPEDEVILGTQTPEQLPVSRPSTPGRQAGTQEKLPVSRPNIPGRQAGTGTAGTVGLGNGKYIMPPFGITRPSLSSFSNDSGCSPPWKPDIDAALTHLGEVQKEAHSTTPPPLRVPVTDMELASSSIPEDTPSQVGSRSGALPYRTPGITQLHSSHETTQSGRVTKRLTQDSTSSERDPGSDDGREMVDVHRAASETASRNVYSSPSHSTSEHDASGPSCAPPSFTTMGTLMDDSGDVMSMNSNQEDSTSSSWLSDVWEDPPTISDDHPFMRLRDVAFHILLRNFCTWQLRAAPMDAQQESSPPSQSSPSSKGGSDSKGKKRQQPGGGGRAGGDGLDNEGDNESQQAVRSKKRCRMADNVVAFACPYMKKDLMKYCGCCRYVLRRIRDVKQHLRREHKMPLYCPICIAIFETEDARDVHILGATCRTQAVDGGTRPQKPDGITESQMKQLHRRPPSNSSSIDQWYVMFDILFPGHQPRPKSPYVDSALLQNVTNYQEFLTRHGPVIISNVLTARGAVTWNLPNEERDLAGFQQRMLEEGLRTVFDQWASQQGRQAAGSGGTLNTMDPSTTAASSSSGGQATLSSSSFGGSSFVDVSDPSASSSRLTQSGGGLRDEAGSSGGIAAVQEGGSGGDENLMALGYTSDNWFEPEITEEDLAEVFLYMS